jgi:hypothetical protein
MRKPLYTLKEEYQPGGSKRQEILDKAVKYLKLQAPSRKLDKKEL